MEPKVFVSARVFYEEIRDLIDDHAKIAHATGDTRTGAALHAMATIIMERARRDQRAVTSWAAPARGVVPDGDDPTERMEAPAPAPAAPAATIELSDGELTEIMAEISTRKTT